MKLNRCVPFLLLVLSFVVSLAAQPSSLNLFTPNPTPVTNVGAAVIGTPGTASYCYYVVATYPIGNAPMSNGAFISQAPNTLTSGNNVSVTWQTVTGATSYTLLRTTTPNPPAACTSFPPPTCTCKLVTQAGNTYSDIGGSLTSYTSSTAPNATAQITLDNQTAGAPFLNYNLKDPTLIAGPNKVPILFGATTAGDCLAVGTLPGQIVDSGTPGCGTGGTFAQTIASGTASLGTTLVSSGTCGTVITSTATGVLTTDSIISTTNADVSGITGYTPATTGKLYYLTYPTANSVNFKLCNGTSADITPGAVTLNWRVVR